MTGKSDETWKRALARSLLATLQAFSEVSDLVVTEIVVEAIDTTAITDRTQQITYSLRVEVRPANIPQSREYPPGDGCGHA